MSCCVYFVVATTKYTQHDKARLSTVMTCTTDKILSPASNPNFFIRCGGGALDPGCGFPQRLIPICSLFARRLARACTWGRLDNVGRCNRRADRALHSDMDGAESLRVTTAFWIELHTHVAVVPTPVDRRCYDTRARLTRASSDASSRSIPVFGDVSTSVYFPGFRECQ